EPVQGRFLRVFLLAKERMDAGVGEKVGPWEGVPAWANPIAQARRDELIQRLNIKDTKVPAIPFLTVFDDGSSRGRADDGVSSRRPADQSTFKRRPIVRTVPVHGGITAIPPASAQGLILGAVVAGGISAAVLLALVFWFWRVSRYDVDT